jgi:hypothetical protein
LSDAPNADVTGKTSPLRPKSSTPSKADTTHPADAENGETPTTVNEPAPDQAAGSIDGESVEKAHLLDRFKLRWKK